MYSFFPHFQTFLVKNNPTNKPNALIFSMKTNNYHGLHNTPWKNTPTIPKVDPTTILASVKLQDKSTHKMISKENILAYHNVFTILAVKFNIIIYFQ